MFASTRRFIELEANRHWWVVRCFNKVDITL